MCSGEVVSVSGVDPDVMIYTRLVSLVECFINFRPLAVIFEGVLTLISTVGC